MRIKKSLLVLGLVALLAVALTACGGGEVELVSALDSENAVVAPEWFDQAALDQEIAWNTTAAEDTSLPIWEQAIEPEWVDTSMYAVEGDFTVCFSNAGVNNPWRVVGYNTMEHEVSLHDDIKEFIHVDAEGSDEKQIADIEDMLASGNCDVLIVSPNTTAALTPIVEKACEQLPVVVFDRGVQTNCPVSFVRPIGGYLFGVQGANFIVDNLPDGGSVLAFRILPGVDVLENRWAGAKEIFAESNVTVVGVEFTEGSNDRTKAIVEDYIDRYGQIDAVWMDAGATALAGIEAFEDAGLDLPIFVGEDQQDFLLKWQTEGMTAIAPTFPTFQWRTAIIAATKIMNGEPVPAWWVTPQPAVTQENLDYYVNPAMPPLHYAMCGCENMPGYPGEWGGQ